MKALRELRLRADSRIDGLVYVVREPVRL